MKQAIRRRIELARARNELKERRRKLPSDRPPAPFQEILKTLAEEQQQCLCSIATENSFQARLADDAERYFATLVETCNPSKRFWELNVIPEPEHT